MEQAADFFLIVDSYSGTLRSKMQVLGVNWEGKSLRSSTPNWQLIAELAESDKCRGVILTLTEQVYVEVARTAEERCFIDDSVVQRVFEAIGGKPHLVLAHEALVGGAALYDRSEVAEGLPAREEEGYEWFSSSRDFFGDIDEDVRIEAHACFEAWGIELYSYRKNVEAEQLASHFIEDANSNLMLRVYVPNGQLYQEETEQLLSIFHKWLRSIRKINVRKDGYSSGKGSVVEFHAGSRHEVQIFQAEIPQFRKFASTVGDIHAAESMLLEYGIKSHEASKLISEFSRSFKRLGRDMRHKEERAKLELRHQLEEELGEELLDEDSDLIMQVVERVIPPVTIVLGTEVSSQGVTQITVNNTVNQQLIGRAEGIVAQHMSGTATLSQGAAEFEALITTYAESVDKPDLIRALRELDDEAAPGAERVKAKGKLRTFLASVADKATSSAIGIGQKFLESQLGI